MSEEMYDDGTHIFVTLILVFLFDIYLLIGYKKITNIDFSSVVINQNIERVKDKPEMRWIVMDALSLDFPDASFNAVICKATFDAIVCGANATENIAKLCSEVSRVLKPGGIFIIISFGGLHSRNKYLEHDAYNWTVRSINVPKPMVSAAALTTPGDATGNHYVYICIKN